MIRRSGVERKAEVMIEVKELKEGVHAARRYCTSTTSTVVVSVNST